MLNVNLTETEILTIGKLVNLNLENFSSVLHLKLSKLNNEGFADGLRSLILKGYLNVERNKVEAPPKLIDLVKTLNEPDLLVNVISLASGSMETESFLIRGKNVYSLKKSLKKGFWIRKLQNKAFLINFLTAGLIADLTTSQEKVVDRKREITFLFKKTEFSVLSLITKIYSRKVKIQKLKTTSPFSFKSREVVDEMKKGESLDSLNLIVRHFFSKVGGGKLLNEDEALNALNSLKIRKLVTAIGDTGNMEVSKDLFPIITVLSTPDKATNIQIMKPFSETSRKELFFFRQEKTLIMAKYPLSKEKGEVLIEVIPNKKSLQNFFTKVLYTNNLNIAPLKQI